jgi:hypothetical protein
MRTPVRSLASVWGWSQLLCFALLCGCKGAADVATPATSSASTPAPAAVTLDFSSGAATVASGGSVQLTWSANNATACMASGAWSGTRATSGSESTGNLTSNATFTLLCSGAGTSASKSVAITVTPGSPPPPVAAAPTVVLSANPLTIAASGQSTLSWTSTNASSCTASGGWSGAKGTSGSASVGPLSQSTAFTLACSGTGGSVSQTVTVAVSAGGTASLAGSVDSVYINRAGDNRVYVFAGTVTPRDIQGTAGDPLATLPVTQDSNACTFSYSAATLSPGTYTIAFTHDAANDQPTQANSLTFVGTRQITVTSGTTTTANFRPATVLSVGPGRQYATLRAANAVAVDGSLVEIDPGTYTDDITVWRQNGVVLRGVGATRPILHSTQLIPYVSGNDQQNGKGIVVVEGSNISVENLEISGARVTDANGAAVRNDGQNLTVCNGYFHDNENGFLGGAYGTLTVEYTEFANNGSGDVGHTHNIYVDDGNSAGDKLVFRYNYSHNVSIGHTLKTRARENYVLYNRLTDETTGSSSYNIDVPNGGLTFVIGNVIQQGVNTDNPTMISYGAEGLTAGRTQELYVVNNTLVNDLGSGTLIQVQTGTSLLRMVNNLFVGGGTVVSGISASAATNLTTDAPGFVNRTGFDYHLVSSSPARDAGSDPGSAQGMSLQPVYQYVQKAQREVRPTDSAIDIGAYEFH